MQVLRWLEANIHKHRQHGQEEHLGFLEHEVSEKYSIKLWVNCGKTDRSRNHCP